MSKLTVSIKKGAEANGFNVSRDLASLISEHIEEGYIIIPRSELPKVELDGNRAYGGTCSRNIHEGLGEIRDTAFALLAIGEFIEFQGPKIAHRKERRDELAQEITGETYRSTTGGLQVAIDRIIDLEQAAK